MKYIKTQISGIWILEPKVFFDKRGYFMETWKEEEFNRETGQSVRFVQENESASSRGVLRGMHYQAGDFSQAKLVRVINGAVFDVAVDLRKSSPTFGQHVCVELNDRNHCQLFIPRGFAHGFQVLSESAVFTYKVDNVYSPEKEVSIRYDDDTLNIKWPITDKDSLILSDKDLNKSVHFSAALFFE